MVLELEQMGRTFARITFNGVKDKGAAPPPSSPRLVGNNESQDPDCCEPDVWSQAFFAKKARSLCSEKSLRRAFPVANWLPKYTKPDDIIGDLIAGITVGFTIIPQGIAFAELAMNGFVVEFISAPVTAGFVTAAAIVIIFSQLKIILGIKGIHGEELSTMIPGLYGKFHETNPYDACMGIVSIIVLLSMKYGLYSGFLGSLVYILLGTVKEITIGPAAVICILLGGATADFDKEYVVTFSILLCLISGLFCMAMGGFKLGFVVEFISAPVTAGFVTAAAIVIIFSQLKIILGIKGIHGEELSTMIPGLYGKFHETNPYDACMGIVSIIVLLSMKKLRDVNLKDVVTNPTAAKALSKILWTISAARNVIWLLVCSTIASVINNRRGENVFSLTQRVKISGIPVPRLPEFHIPAHNVTIDGHHVRYVPEMGFWDILVHGGSILFVIPMICLVEQIAVCKSFAKAKPVDVNQELMALGISQTMAVFFQSMPVTGSICRSAVNAVSGVRTPFGGFWSGAIVLLALSFFTQYLEYIPKSTLGAIVVCAVIHMIEYEETLHIWQTKRRDMLPLVVTFFAASFIGLEWGFMSGVVINILMLLYFAATPRVPILKFKLTEDKRVVVLRPDRSLHYPGVEKVRNLLSKKALMHKDAMIVVDCINLIDIDFTGAKGLGSVAAALRERSQQIVFVNVQPNINRALRGFTHGDVDTFETAQDWIDTLSDTRNRHTLHRTLSNPEGRKRCDSTHLFDVEISPEAKELDVEGVDVEEEIDDGDLDTSGYIDDNGVDIRL
ncbi:unnamed protein product [Notodromas monacha]|uniref:STAS domain-containing protein n=1 Tax=Notodromas monacha TaxID=399045 RepID=A0A7R9BR53_9CRUS|nr:unnamed protein product [Notodromas monacha]CAG0918800.1 unnamed protein product [Notodromas monacha]